MLRVMEVWIWHLQMVDNEAYWVLHYSQNLDYYPRVPANYEKWEFWNNVSLKLYQVPSVWISTKMSIYKPPTLCELAVQSLLWNEATAISTLEYLPINLFPQVFKEAFTGRRMGLLKAMVVAWPFSYLPVGALMKTPDVELFQAVLDGVDIL